MTKGNFGYVVPDNVNVIKGATVDVTGKYKGEVINDDLLNHVRFLYGVSKNMIQVTTGRMILDSVNGRLWFFIDEKEKVLKIELERYMAVTKYLEEV